MTTRAPALRRWAQFHIRCGGTCVAPGRPERGGWPREPGSGCERIRVARNLSHLGRCRCPAADSESDAMRKSRPLCATFLASLALVACHPHEDEQGDDFALSTRRAGCTRGRVRHPRSTAAVQRGHLPCSDCHSEDVMPANPKRRELKIAHQDIALKHDAEHRWCLDCHARQRPRFPALGERRESAFRGEHYCLCGQCHGDKYRDWRAGVHGRRTGHWDGEEAVPPVRALPQLPRPPPSLCSKPEAPPERPVRTP